MSNIKSSSIIALAWPETKVRRIGVWYDRVTQWLGFINGDYYKAGHAAAVLVDHSTGGLQYFDFGRYHTPEKMGRLRSNNTDPELTLNVRASFHNSGEIENIDDVLSEIAAHPSTHGDGTMYASVAGGINFEKAHDFTANLQQNGLVHYGPFDWRGTNCSRFVRDIVRTSTSSLWTKIRLSFPWTLTPATKWNVLKAHAQGEHYEVNDQVLVHKNLTLLERFESFIDGLINRDVTSPEPELIFKNSQNTCVDGKC